MAEPSAIPIAIVGLNFGGKVVRDQVAAGLGAAAGFRLAAVCDLDAAKVREFSARYGVAGYTDLGDLLARGDIPAVGLFTGPEGRAGLLRRIVRAGKHALTTKPFELDADAALTVLREARALGRAIHVNSPAPCASPDLRQIRQWRDAFDLGRPVGGHLATWASYREAADGSWHDDPTRCPVAPIFRLGVYLINDLVLLLGEAEHVAVQASRVFTQRPTPDNAQLALRFRNGALATVYASFGVEDGDHYRNAMVLHFERGTVYRNAGPARGAAAGELALVMGSGRAPRRIAAAASVDAVSGAYQWDAFARAVRGEPRAEVTTPEHIVAGLRILEAMARADRGDGVATVRPVEAVPDGGRPEGAA